MCILVVISLKPFFKTMKGKRQLKTIKVMQKIYAHINDGIVNYFANTTYYDTIFFPTTITTYANFLTSNLLSLNVCHRNCS